MSSISRNCYCIVAMGKYFSNFSLQNVFNHDPDLHIAEQQMWVDLPLPSVCSRSSSSWLRSTGSRGVVEPWPTSQTHQFSSICSRTISCSILVIMICKEKFEIHTQHSTNPASYNKNCLTIVKSCVLAYNCLCWQFAAPVHSTIPSDNLVARGKEKASPHLEKLDGHLGELLCLQLYKGCSRYQWGPGLAARWTQSNILLCIVFKWFMQSLTSPICKHR